VGCFCFGLNHGTRKGRRPAGREKHAGGMFFSPWVESPLGHHVGASFISLAPTFLQKSERAHAAAPPFQMRPAALGSHLVFGAGLRQIAYLSHRGTSPQALYRLRLIF